MASLRELKDRIGSVRSTLKITSAMKLVSSSKLRKAQTAIENMLPYQKTLQDILASAYSAMPESAANESEALPQAVSKAPVGIIAVSSNSSLCGGFNANAIKETISQIRACGDDVVVFPVGKKMAEAMRKIGFVSETDWSAVIGKPSYESSAALAEKVVGMFNRGELSRVVLVYNHFISTASQKPVTEQYLPVETPAVSGHGTDSDYYIMEPSPKELIESLMPQVLRLRIYTMILDSAAAEHAARTIAMQTATDNGEDILSSLTLEYNKGRQQKITAEILDLLGGAQ